MQNNCLLENENSIIRILDVQHEQVFIIDCINLTMPKWIPSEQIRSFTSCAMETLSEKTGVKILNMEDLNKKEVKFVREHFTFIASYS